MDQDATNFLEALAEGIHPNERMIICGFPGDPGKVIPNAWKPRPWAPGRDINLGSYDNAYVAVSSFYKGGDGSFRRRTENFAAGRALMIDDVGTKIPLVQICAEDGTPVLKPSAIIETSPGNYQWWYFLREPERFEERFAGVIRSFIQSRLMGQDPGMAGSNRVGRIPGFWNAKPRLVTPKTPHGWKVKMHKLYDVRYSIEEIIGCFQLRILPKPFDAMARRLNIEESEARIKAFTPIEDWLLKRGLLKRRPDKSGWMEMTCPWRDEHTGTVDTGAAIREPARENGWYGAFRCHHGHCVDRGWRELTDWVVEAANEELETANANASKEVPA